LCLLPLGGGDVHMGAQLERGDADFVGRVHSSPSK
jgi:hypothetical protein